MPPRKKKPLPTPADAPAAPPATPEPSPSPQPIVPTASLPESRAANAAPPPAPIRTWQPDPFVLMTVILGQNRASPRMRLYRSNRFNQMAIRFDEPPERQYRERLREEGWRWREAESVWTKQLDREQRAAGHLEAERLFTEIGEAIRADLGLEPQRTAGR